MTDADHPGTPSRLQSLLELLGLSGLAIAQPLLTTFGDSPDFFVFRQASTEEIVLFAIAVALLPGLLAWCAAVIVGVVSRRARTVVHHVAVLAFVAIGILQLTAGAEIALPIGVPLAVLGACVVIAARLRWSAWRSWLRWLAPAPFAFAALFLFTSPVSALVTGDEIDPADLGAFGSGDPPPVVVMVFDEWPLSSIVRTDATIDEEVAPNVARLADRSTWYRNTTTVANITNFAVPSILTGSMPEPGDRAEASSHPENLFTLLGGTYDLDVKESLTRLCPPSLCEAEDESASTADRATRLGDLLGEAREVLSDRLRPTGNEELVTDGFVEPDVAVEAAEADEGTFNLDELLAPRPERLDDFIDGFEADEAPTVHYVHVLGPHTPYRHVPSGVRYPSDGALRLISPPDGSPGSDLRAAATWPARLDRQRLLLEVGHIDQLIGDVLDELEADGLYDDALVVLTSDHGIAFEPGASVRGLGDRPVEREIEPDLLWVPLLVKEPGQAVGEVSDRDARTIDIVPTIAGHLGIDLPWAVDGTDLDGTDDDRGPKQFVRIAGSSFAVFEVGDPVAVRADPDEVFERGTDSLLRGSGPARWWGVGPEPDLVGTRVGEARFGPVRQDRHRLDDPNAYEDVDLSSGEAPLLVSGRILRDDEPRPGAGPIALLIDDVIAAVVPTYQDDQGPGRFAAMVDPRWFEDGDGRIRIADVTTGQGRATLSLIPES